MAHGFRSNHVVIDDSRTTFRDASGRIWLQVTLELKENDKVSINLGGHLFRVDSPQLTYFEGRLVSALE